MRILDFAARNRFELVSYVFNMVLTLVAAIAFLRLWGLSSDRWSAVGGIPPLNADGVVAAATAPGALDRVLSLGMFWIYAVFAVGCLVLAVAGTRHLVLAARRLASVY